MSYTVTDKNLDKAIEMLAFINCHLRAMEREKGKNIDEVAKWVEDNKCRCHQMGFLDDLTFVAMKGRISKAKAFINLILSVGS